MLFDDFKVFCLFRELDGVKSLEVYRGCMGKLCKNKENIEK